MTNVLHLLSKKICNGAKVLKKNEEIKMGEFWVIFYKEIFLSFIFILLLLLVLFSNP